MYNRYTQNDTGRYRRVNAEEPSRRPEPPPSPPPQKEGAPLGALLGKNGLLSGVLDKLKLQDLDSGDLLLLVLLFLLFRDGEDDELLIALGLLLIL